MVMVGETCGRARLESLHGGRAQLRLRLIYTRRDGLILYPFVFDDVSMSDCKSVIGVVSPAAVDKLNK